MDFSSLTMMMNHGEMTDTENRRDNTKLYQKTCRGVLLTGFIILLSTIIILTKVLIDFLKQVIENENFWSSVENVYKKECPPKLR